MENKKSVVIVTGASRGLGRSFALEISKVVGEGSVFFLMARSMDGLEKTKELILQNQTEKVFEKIVCTSVDNSKPDESEFKKIFDDNFPGSNVSDFEQAIIVHNAGSIGNQGTLSKDFSCLE